MAFNIINLAPPITEMDLAEIENRLGLVLPEDLRQHYLRFNGGHPLQNLFPKAGEYFSISEFLPIKYGTRGARLEDAYVDIVQGNDQFPSDLIPIANDAGGDFFCYCLAPDNLGAISFYQSDYYDDPSRAVVHLAKDLKGFLNSLVAEDEVGS